MIYIVRNARDEQGTRIRPSPWWFALSAQGTARALRDKGGHQADESIYAHNEVRAALERLFHDKCAYCEYPTERCDWNVEHYRPKGRVAERRDHPGYYWLAYKWENLYPVCAHCNQRRKDKPRWKDPVVGAGGGKLDQFPLVDEAMRAMRPSQRIRREQTLLIDPCYDDPADYLSFDVTGQIMAVENNRYGLKTIEVCHLGSRRLRDARKKVIDNTIDLMKTIQKARAQRINRVAQDLENLLKNSFLADTCNYAAAARAVQKDPRAFGVT